jgi:hypothetical protein
MADGVTEGSVAGRIMKDTLGELLENFFSILDHGEGMVDLHENTILFHQL